MSKATHLVAGEDVGDRTSGCCTAYGRAWRSSARR